MAWWYALGRGLAALYMTATATRGLLPTYLEGGEFGSVLTSTEKRRKSVSLWEVKVRPVSLSR
jgi:hypothetical protein